jgi:hypothetical protein
VEAHTARMTRGVWYEGACRRLQRESGRPDYIPRGLSTDRSTSMESSRDLPT